MGNKTHPIGFRLGVIKDWQAKWFAGKQKEYRELVIEDMVIRNAIYAAYTDAGISRVEIERGSNEVISTIHTARPGIVIGRGGQKVEELRKDLEGLTKRRARLNVQEIRQPELDAYLVARGVADQLIRRIAFRRAIRQTVTRTMQAGAQGIKVVCSGRLGGADIARTEKAMDGRVPLHTLRADIDYSYAEAHTEYGQIGVKVWIYKGEILPIPKQEEEEIAPIEVTVRADEEEEIAPIEVTVRAGEVEEIPPIEVTVKADKEEETASIETTVKADEKEEIAPIEATGKVDEKADTDAAAEES